MMLYCQRCKRFVLSDACPECGRKHGLREPQSCDPVRLAALPFLLAGMVEPVLKESGIPYSRMDQMGWGLSLGLGTLNESILFYVPWAAHAQARELLERVFGEDEEIMKNMD